MKVARFTTFASNGPSVQQVVIAGGDAPPAVPGFGLHVGVTHVMPGGSTDLLRHEVAEAVAVVEGTLEMRLDGMARVIGKGDAFVIPPSAWHAFTNPGETAASMLFAFGGDPAPLTERRAPEQTAG
jgi:quercetin dioxygenase-like cupin family protein